MGDYTFKSIIQKLFIQKYPFLQNHIPFFKHVKAKQLKYRLQRKSLPLKSLLLNQHFDTTNQSKQNNTHLFKPNHRDQSVKSFDVRLWQNILHTHTKNGLCLPDNLAASLPSSFPPLNYKFSRQANLRPSLSHIISRSPLSQPT